MYKRFSPHNHTDKGSNLRILDSINKIESLVEYGVKIGLAGLAITDHECLSQSIQVCKLQDKYPDFKIAIGNEIYLVDEREKGIAFPHFILIAKDAIGHRQLKELSSIAWMNSYYDRGLERVPTTKADLKRIVKMNPNHLIATTACIGGELSRNILAMEDARKVGDKNEEVKSYNNIVDFMQYCIDLFGDDFYVEIAPGASKEQIIANNKLVQIASVFKVKVVIGDDSHYLRKNDRYVHKAYLNSSEGDREVDAFYQYSYLHTEEELAEDLAPSVGVMLEEFCANSMEMFDKISIYDLRHSQNIPTVEVKDYPACEDKSLKKFPILSSMKTSKDKVERCWVNECLLKLKELESNNRLSASVETYLAELEDEADIKRTIGEKLDTNMFKYPLTLKHYIDMFWDCGSIVGAGRGSSCAGLNHYLLGVTQLDPIKWKLPFFRYMNKERVELGDIDLDLCPSKRPLIMKKIKEERGKNFLSEIDDLTRENCGATFIATFGTETAKSAIITACRGYRSEEYPNGIDSDTANYLSSLVPVERGFNWTIGEMINGNPDKGRMPVTLFIAEVNKYPGLLEIIQGIEGLVKSRGIHASGVILFDEDPYEYGCFMKSPNGEIITQYDLHDDEAAGLTKYDFLLTSVQDMILQAIKLLQENGEIEKDLSIREVYDKYFHPEILPIDDIDTWKNIDMGKILACFQFDSDIGSQAIKKIQPDNIVELSNANGLLRLMAPDGEENPMDKYVRFKKDPNAWQEEMNKYGLTTKEKEVFARYLSESCGVGISQEQLMLALMDKDICGFELGDANAARKIVGKKQMSKIPELKEKIFAQATSPAVSKYMWDAIAKPQMGYSFSKIHALAYSFIGYQTAYIATKWSPIYWDTAVLIVNSGSLEEEHEPDEDEETKEKNTNYEKVAKALGEIREHGIKISLIDINKSDYGFKPDVANNQILFGMKALAGLNSEMIEDIKNNRPYVSIKDFMNRVKIKKPAMISLIKGGAFDNITNWIDVKEPRYANMVYYISQISEPKTKLTLQNLKGLIKKDLLPEELNKEKSIFWFNKYLLTHKWVNREDNQTYYVMPDAHAQDFYNKYFDAELLNIVQGTPIIEQKTWKKFEYDVAMDKVREWLKEHQKEVLDKYNSILFKEVWDKYASGNISHWEMESLCFYYNEHELINVNNEKYGIDDFFAHSEIPEIKRFWKRGNHQIPIYNLYRIAGTVISKNDVRHSIALLTTGGVVSVKFTRDLYAMYKRQISEPQADGTKKVVEKGWFTRGTKLLLNGFRRDDTFVIKKYASTVGHSVYKIIDVDDNGNIILESSRSNDED